jgi:predicted metalloprotease
MADWGKILSRGNVEDRRGLAPIAGAGGLGLVGVLAVIGFNLLTGGNLNPAQVNDVLTSLQQLQPAQTNNQLQPEQFRGKDSYETFASTVLGSTNDTWQQVFKDSGQSYHEPTLVLFRDATNSACGGATSQVGPHYCPTDQTIYLDETFFDELKNRLGGSNGDVAQAYVIAHEVGHHVQNELGIMDQVRQREQADPGQQNQWSIRLELQADCFAGIWANSIKQLNIMQPGEVNEAIDAAAAVGDDRIQQKVQGQINPETWTHGSAQQRVDAFQNGYASGNPASCKL